MPEARSEQTNPAHVRALAVVVIYRMPFAQSKTLAGLARAFAERNPYIIGATNSTCWCGRTAPRRRGERELRWPPHLPINTHSGANEVSGAYNAAAIE